MVLETKPEEVTMAEKKVVRPKFEVGQKVKIDAGNAGGIPSDDNFGTVAGLGVKPNTYLVDTPQGRLQIRREFLTHAWSPPHAR